jgi:hypothetical protein
MAAGKPVLCEKPLAPTLPAIEAYLCAHEEHLYFAGVVVEFTSQTGLNPETADRAARPYRDQRRVMADLMQQSRGQSPASGVVGRWTSIIWMVLNFSKTSTGRKTQSKFVESAAQSHLQAVSDKGNENVCFNPLL